MKLSKSHIFDCNTSECFHALSYHSYRLKCFHSDRVVSSKHLYKLFTKLCNCLNHHLIRPIRIEGVHFIIFFILLCSSFQLSLSECHFHEHWRGNWFQKGVSNLINISKFNISEKGICKRNNGDKFLIENRNENCIRCLVISERHPNILQYKETNYCYPISELSFDICSDINGDAPLFSLFRVNTSPIKCPFKGPYTFSYSKGLNECKDPLSEIDQCTDDNHLLLKFRACADIPGSESKIEELECIAEWKDGSYKFLVGKLHHRMVTSDEDKFRCFVIEKNNSNVESYNIGQSGDASCEGLFSPRDGLRTFKIRKSNEIQPKCDFPDWLVQNRQWKTLDNRHIYDFSPLNTFSVYNNKKDIYRNSKCIQSVDVPFFYNLNTSRFIIHTTLGCKSGFACMQAYFREERIAEIQIGNIVSYKSDACSLNNFNPRTNQYSTITTLDDITRPCNLKGIFSIKSKVPYMHNGRVFNSTYSRFVSLLDFICPEKSFKLKSNCDDPDQFQFTCSLHSRIKNFKCRGGWRDNNTEYFIVSFIDRFNYEHCISYNIEMNEMKLYRNSAFCYRENKSLEQSVNTHVDFLPKYHSFNDDLVSFTLINEGSCNQRSSGSSVFNAHKYTIIIFVLNIFPMYFTFLEKMAKLCL